MIRTIPLTQLVDAVDANLPAGTIVLDPEGNSIVFYKYKGTLVERDSVEFNERVLRSRAKYSLNRGSTLALKIHEEDDITSFFVPGVIDPRLFNRSKITTEILDTYMDARDDYVVMQDKYRIVFLVKGSQVPRCLEPFVKTGDLVPVNIR